MKNYLKIKKKPQQLQYYVLDNRKKPKITERIFNGKTKKCIECFQTKQIFKKHKNQKYIHKVV
jgi:hypothetical protein